MPLQKYVGHLAVFLSFSLFDKPYFYKSEIWEYSFGTPCYGDASRLWVLFDIVLSNIPLILRCNETFSRKELRVMSWGKKKCHIPTTNQIRPLVLNRNKNVNSSRLAPCVLCSGAYKFGTGLQIWEVQFSLRDFWLLGAPHLLIRLDVIHLNTKVRFSRIYPKCH